MESTLDILQILLTHNQADNFNIAKSIAEAGGLGKMSDIALCAYFLPHIALKATKIREKILAKFVTFVLTPKTPKTFVLSEK